MKDKNLNLEENTGNPEVRPDIAIPSFGRFFEKHGIYDGKIFHTSDKVTYTFINHEEVVSLHFDLNKRTIFYKGHSITNLSLSEKQLRDLDQFKIQLEKNPKTIDFIVPFVETLNQYLSNFTFIEEKSN